MLWRGGHVMGFRHFVSGAWSYDENIGHGAQRRELFDGLVRRAVFTNADGVMCEDIDNGNFHKAGETHGRLHVVAEIEKCPTEGAQAAETHAAHRRAHGMFTHAVVDVAAAVLAGEKFTGP